MNTDSAFVIGKTHKVCQDYTSHGLEIYLADGCSSSPDTDIGARLLVRAAHLYDIDAPNSAQLTIKRADEWRYDLGLQKEALDATLLRASVNDGILTTRMYGDGVIALKRRWDQSIVAFSVEYYGNAPQYLSYDLDMERRGLWESFRPQNKRTVTVYELDQNTQRDLSDEKEEFLSFADDTKYYEWVALMSDGVHSFTDDGGSIPLSTVLPRLLDFKNLNGEFVQRRMARFQKDITSRGWIHNDDLSLAVMNLGE